MFHDYDNFTDAFAFYRLFRLPKLTSTHTHTNLLKFCEEGFFMFRDFQWFFSCFCHKMSGFALNLISPEKKTHRKKLNIIFSCIFLSFFKFNLENLETEKNWKRKSFICVMDYSNEIYVLLCVFFQDFSWWSRF